MEPWGTPALTGYSWEDFPSRTTWSCLLLRKDEIKPNIWPEILSKVLDISSATARVVSDLLKALPILSDITVKKSAIDQEY